MVEIITIEIILLIIGVSLGIVGTNIFKKINIKITIISILAGIIIGGVVSAGTIFYIETMKTNFILKKDILLENGSFIKKGTYLKLRNPMPEGFDNLSLSINIDGSEINELLEIDKKMKGINIPYWKKPKE